MKVLSRGLVFVGLKVAEVVGVMGFPYLIGRFAPHAVAKLIPAFNPNAATYWGCWANGWIVAIGLVVAIMALGMVIVAFSALGKWNWELAKEILQKRLVNK